jgi:hypothetical protein
MDRAKVYAADGGSDTGSSTPGTPNGQGRYQPVEKSLPKGAGREGMFPAMDLVSWNSPPPLPPSPSLPPSLPTPPPCDCNTAIALDAPRMIGSTRVRCPGHCHAS